MLPLVGPPGEPTHPRNHDGPADYRERFGNGGNHMRVGSTRTRSILAVATAACLAMLGLGAATSVAGASDGPSTDNRQTGNDMTPTEGTFDALTYNVAGLPVGLSSSQPDINTPFISPLLNDYDLVLVQEDWANPDPPLDIRVFHELLVADVTHPYLSTPAPVPLGTNPLRPTALLSDGLNRMSRFPFGEITRVMWPNCFGGIDTSDGGAGDCLAEKGFSVARTEFAPGVEVDVYNLHAEAGNTPADMAAHEEDFVVLAEFMATYSAGRPVIVGGDFNLHTDRPFHGQVFADFLATTGLTDVCGVLDCGTDKDRIDKFVFRSGAGITLEPLGHTFESATFVRPGDGEPLSDHTPLHVPFRWTLAQDPDPEPTTTTTTAGPTSTPTTATTTPAPPPLAPGGEVAGAGQAQAVAAAPRFTG